MAEVSNKPNEAYWDHLSKTEPQKKERKFGIDYDRLKDMDYYECLRCGTHNQVLLETKYRIAVFGSVAQLCDHCKERNDINRYAQKLGIRYLLEQKFSEEDKCKSLYERRSKLAAKDGPLTEEENKELEELNNEIEKYTFTHFFSNNYFEFRGGKIYTGELMLNQEATSKLFSSMKNYYDMEKK